MSWFGSSKKDKAEPDDTYADVDPYASREETPDDDPFAALDRLLPKDAPSLAGFDFVLVDVHGEATSEKMAYGHFLDGFWSPATNHRTDAYNGSLDNRLR